MKVECPNCNSTDVEYKCQHNNRRKKVLIHIYLCKQCKKRFNVELDKLYYNHKGNLMQRRHLCNTCGKKIEPDNDTERILNCHLDCIVKNWERYLEDIYETPNDYIVSHFEGWL